MVKRNHKDLLNPVYPYDYVLNILKEQHILLSDNPLFLRPHHIGFWYDLVIFKEQNRPSYSEFVSYIQRDLEKIAKKEILQLLSGKLLPKDIGIEVEYLNILTKPYGKKLSTIDKAKLMNIDLKPANFAALAKKQADLFNIIWEMPDETSVVLVKVLDQICTLLSEKGCSHCILPPTSKENDTDELCFTILNRIKNSDSFSMEMRNKIKIAYDFRTDTIISIILPLSLIKQINFLNIIQNKGYQIATQATL